MLNDFSVATAVVFLVQANSLCNLDDYNQIIWPYLLQYQCDLLHIWVFLIISWKWISEFLNILQKNETL